MRKILVAFTAFAVLGLAGLPTARAEDKGGAAHKKKAKAEKKPTGKKDEGKRASDDVAGVGDTASKAFK
jgi:hypothetical protein